MFKFTPILAGVATHADEADTMYSQHATTMTRIAHALLAPHLKHQVGARKRLGSSFFSLLPTRRGNRPELLTISRALFFNSATLTCGDSMI